MTGVVHSLEFQSPFYRETLNLCTKNVLLNINIQVVIKEGFVLAEPSPISCRSKDAKV